MYLSKRPVALFLLVTTLVLTVTGLWLWLGAPGGGGRGAGPSGLRHLLKDIHLYASWGFMAAVVGHLVCNGRAMLRHLGVNVDTKNPASPGKPRQR